MLKKRNGSRSTLLSLSAVYRMDYSDKANGAQNTGAERTTAVKWAHHLTSPVSPGLCNESPSAQFLSGDDVEDSRMMLSCLQARVCTLSCINL